METWKKKDDSDYKYKGEWVDEPDKAHWIDEATGLDCLIVRNNCGALCGYVGIPKSNKFFKKDYDNVEADIKVHGGLTFADFCMNTKDESIGVCHPKETAANELVWWLGFDCAHSGDVCPKYESDGLVYGYHPSYKNFAYVKKEVISLAKQLNDKRINHELT